MRQIIISEKDLNSIKFSSNEDNQGYLQIFYNDLDISSTANAIVHKILKDHKADINKDNYGLIGDNRKTTDQSSSNINIDGFGDREYISWDNPYEIINLNTCDIINETSNKSDKLDISNPLTDHTERVIYLNNRIVITGQLIDTISRENNPDLIKRVMQTDMVCNPDKLKYIYIFKYRVYLNKLLNINNNPDNLIKISEITFMDDNTSDIDEFLQRSIVIERADCLDSINNILGESSFKLDNIINKLFTSIYIDADSNSVNFLLNLVTGHELEDEFIFKNPDNTLNPNRILVRETTNPIREDVRDYNMRSLIELGYETEEKTIIDSPDSRYIEINKKPHKNSNELTSASDLETFDLEIKIYENLEDLQRNLQEQDKKQLVNLDDYRNSERKETVQKFNTVTSLEKLDPSLTFGNQTDQQRAYIKSVEINNKLNEDLTYEKLRKSENMPDIIINNLEVLFDSMDHVDNLGHIKFLYKTLMIIADTLKNLITPEEEQDLINKISKYKDYIYVNQQELTVADIFNINEDYLRDHEITLQERADLIKTSINDMNLGGSSSEDRQRINEKLHSIRVKIACIKLSLDALIMHDKRENDNSLQKKVIDLLSGRNRKNKYNGDSGDPFENRDPFNQRDIILTNIAVPDDILEILKTLSNKYRALEVSNYSSDPSIDRPAEPDDFDKLNGFGGYD